MLAISVTIAVVFGFEQLTHVLWLDGPASPLLAAQHHGVTLLAMLLGGIVGMMSAFAVLDTTARDRVITLTLFPIPVLATMALAVALVPHHELGIVVMTLVMGGGTFLRRFVPRFGSRAFLCGALLFVGYLFGFLSRGAVSSSQLPGLAAVLWLSCAVNLALKLIVFAPLERGQLARTGRAFYARCRSVVTLAEDLLQEPSDRARRRLRVRMARMNETALVIDALLSEAEGLEPGAALAGHRRLFGVELAVQNVGRLSLALSSAPLDDRLRAEIHGWFTQPPSQVPYHGRVARLATALADWRRVADGWPERERAFAEGRIGEHESAVELLFGNLPGSALVSFDAASGADGTWRKRLGLDAAAQAAIRVAVAVGAAAAVGSILSERRFYWAVIAVFIAFMGANTSGEQVAKAGARVVGTVVGILVGSVLAHWIGHSTWSVVVIVASLGFGVYLMRVSYAFMTIGVTVMVSQLYEQLGEYSNHLLLLRLEETAIGAGIAMLTAVVVFPVRTRAAARLAVNGYFEALGRVLDGVTGRLEGRTADGSLTNDVRGLDHISQQLQVTARPLARGPWRRRQVEHNLGLFDLAVYHARSVTADADRGIDLTPTLRESAVAVLGTQRAAVQELAAGERNGVANGLRDRLDEFGDTDMTPDQRHFMRHLDRLDETLAELRGNLAGTG